MPRAGHGGVHGYLSAAASVTDATHWIGTHEAHLSTFEDPPRAHARLSRAHEVPRRSGGHQRTSRQGAQAPQRLIPRERLVRWAHAPSKQRPHGSRCREQPLENGLAARTALACMNAGPSISQVLRRSSATREALTRQDFQSILASRPVARTEHFALHFRVDEPSICTDTHRPHRTPAAEGPASTNLSTSAEQPPSKPVDNKGVSARIGAVVPKRHARRAVTRNAIKRQIRESAQPHIVALQGATWVVRLKAPWPHPTFTAATSSALRRSVRTELDTLWARRIHA
jgi:ribonuclease P protein component